MGAGKLGSSILTERYSRSLSRAVFFQAAPHSMDDPIVGRLVVVLFGREELCPEVERERLDRSAVAVVRRGEGADGSHGGLPLLSGRANRSLDGGPWPGERSARSRQAQSIAEDGGRRLFLSREECRRLAAGKKSRPSRCGKAIEAQPSLGP